MVGAGVDVAVVIAAEPPCACVADALVAEADAADAVAAGAAGPGVTFGVGRGTDNET